MRALGLISGTSMDGVDVAVLDTDGENAIRFGQAGSYPYSRRLRDALGALIADPQRAEHDALAEIAAAVTAEHGDAVARFLDDHGMTHESVDVIGFHGQTVIHRPERGLTRQLCDGDAFAARFDVSTVTGFRLADVEAGGQGAPLVPLFHRALAADLPRPLAILNLGGVGNVTYVDDETVIAFDTGPANAMLDDWVRARTGRAFDEGGTIAARGQLDATALATLLDNVYFTAPPPKSLDRNDFSPDPVARLTLEDGAATLTAFAAAAVARGISHLPQRPLRWLVTGGGRLNATLMTMLADRLGAPVASVETVGWDGDALEAQAFAWLAVRALRGLPLTLPSTTGAPTPMTGGVIHRPPGR